MHVCNYIVLIILALTQASCVLPSKEIDVIVKKDKIIFSFQRVIDEEKAQTQKWVDSEKAWMDAEKSVGVVLVQLYVKKIEVRPGESSSIWEIINSDQETGLPDKTHNTPTITYGIVPYGMKEKRSAPKLTPGTYRVEGLFFLSVDKEGGREKGGAFYGEFRVE